MKTAEEWVERFKADGDEEFTPSETVEYMHQFVKEIQQDAFLSGQLDGLRQGKETAMKVIDEVFSKKV